MAAKLADNEQKTVAREERIHKALGYPLRHTIFRIVSERVASPAEISRELDEPVSNISHHMRVLEDLDFVEEVGSQPRRGATEHFFQASAKPWIDTSDWDGMPEPARKTLMGDTVERMLADASKALVAGTMGDDSNFVLARDRLIFDEQGYTEARELVDETLLKLVELEELSTNRRAKSGEVGVAASIMQACFRLPSSAP
jgi:DNA-binding transcriptional ArsR family regulator